MRWYTDEAFRRRIGRQLNRGETLNDLRRFIFYAERGKVRYRRLEDQTLQAHRNTLVVNACILSTTGYLQDAITGRGGASGAPPDLKASQVLLRAGGRCLQFWDGCRRAAGPSAAVMVTECNPANCNN